MLPEFGEKTPNLSNYEVGDVVEESGLYICVPCGYKKYFRKGAHFSECLKCMGSREFKKGLELWEKLPEE